MLQVGRKATFRREKLGFEKHHPNSKRVNSKLCEAKNDCVTPHTNFVQDLLVFRSIMQLLKVVQSCSPHDYIVKLVEILHKGVGCPLG